MPSTTSVDATDLPDDFVRNDASPLHVVDRVKHINELLHRLHHCHAIVIVNADGDDEGLPVKYATAPRLSRMRPLHINLFRHHEPNVNVGTSAKRRASRQGSKPNFRTTRMVQMGVHLPRSHALRVHKIRQGRERLYSISSIRVVYTLASCTCTPRHSATNYRGSLRTVAPGACA